VHATLETTDDRNRLVSNASNREVLGKLAEHVADTLEKEASATAPRRALELLAGIEHADPELASLGFVSAVSSNVASEVSFRASMGNLNNSANHL